MSDHDVDKSTLRTRIRIPQVEVDNIVDLYKAGFPLPLISNITGVKLRTVQRWVKLFRDNGGQQSPAIQARGYRACVSTQKMWQVVPQVKANPRISARQLKAANPTLLEGLSIRTIQRWLQDNVGRRKPSTSLNHDGSKSVTRSTIRLDTGSQTHPRATSTETSSEDTCPVSPATGSSEHELLYDDVDLKVEIKEEVVDDMPNFVDVEQVEEPLKIEDDPVDALAKLEPSFPSASTSSTGETVRTTAFRVPDADEFHLFGMFVASQLRAMPMRDALQAQLEIQTILAQKRSERLT